MREHQARTEPVGEERDAVLILSAGGSCRPVRGAWASFPGSWDHDRQPGPAGTCFCAPYPYMLSKE